jgi:hypothetical protein
MDTCLADQVVHPSDIVYDASEIGDHFAKHLAALSVGLEVPHGLLPWSESILEGFHMLSKIAGFAIVFYQVWLEVEKVDMAGSASHEELDDPFGFWGMVQRTLGAVRVKQASEGDTAEPPSALP